MIPKKISHFVGISNRPVTRMIEIVCQLVYRYESYFRHLATN